MHEKRAASQPRLLPMEDVPPLFSEAGRTQATFYDFGSISIRFCWSLGQDVHDIEELPQLSQRLYALDLERQARERIVELTRKIEAAIAHPRLSPLVEDYYLFIIEELREPWSAEELYKQLRADFAQILRFETAPLSLVQQEEATRSKISYYSNDLVLLDWNAALIFDSDYADTANLLERLNVELLEARYLDAQLDKSLNEYRRLVHTRPQWYFPLRTPYKRVVQDLGELRIEASLLAERVDNSLKIIGDQYLAGVYSAAANRFYLREREIIIERKLNILTSLYQLLIDRIRTAQSQMLELAIILLILIEILMPLFNRLLAK